MTRRSPFSATSASRADDGRRACTCRCATGRCSVRCGSPPSRSRPVPCSRPEVGLVIAHGLDVGHPAVWAILLATGSAAIVLPALEEAGDQRRPGAPGDGLGDSRRRRHDRRRSARFEPVEGRARRSRRARGGGRRRVACSSIARCLAREDGGARAPSASRARRAWALDLRVALLALFALCALAQWVGTSIMIAGFAAGLIVAVEGGPHRLSDQVAGVADGFLVPGVLRRPGREPRRAARW